MKKQILVLTMLTSILLVTTACGSTAKQPDGNANSQDTATETPAASETTTTTETATPTELELTLEELSKYNGTDGQPAYIAVDGIIYDVSNSPKWKNGKHNGFQAGKDLTDKIKNVSPHGLKVLERLNKVGTLKTSN